MALTKAQTGLQESREALTLLGNPRAVSLLASHLNTVTELRFSLREKYALTVGEADASRIFEIPPDGKSGGRPGSTPK